MVSVFGDGSSSGGSSKPGGYGFVIVEKEEVLGWGCGGSPATTNTAMEIQALISGLEAVRHLGISGVELVSDSQLALGIASQAYHPSANLELAYKLISLCNEMNVQRFRWVKGHSSNKWNNICDQLAGLGKEENTPEELRKKKTRKAEKKERRKRLKDAQVI
jgi:ribonuclease HI